MFICVVNMHKHKTQTILCNIIFSFLNLKKGEGAVANSITKPHPGFANAEW